MRSILTAVLAIAALSATALASAGVAEAGPYLGQHARVMNSIARTQRRNNTVINRVQSNIRSSQRNRF